MLKERYAVANLDTRFQLKIRLSRMECSGQPITELVGQFEELFNRMAGMKNYVTEETQVAHLLAAFGEKKSSPFGLVDAAMESAGIENSWESATAPLIQEVSERAVSLSSGSMKNAENGATIALTAIDNGSTYGGQPVPHKKWMKREEKRR